MLCLEWRKQGSCSPVTRCPKDLEAADALLYHDDTNPSSGRAFDDLDDVQPSSKRGTFTVNKTWWILTATNAFLACASIVLNRNAHWSFERSCVKQTSAYSPILDSSQPLPFHEVQFNGTLWPPEDLPWSRKEPGDPMAEAIWDSFEDMHTFPITRKQVLALGKDPETAARYDDDYWGMGDDAYIAALDSQHKMHCLNEIRKMVFAEYGNGGLFKKVESQLGWIHLRHCMDMLTQDMLCHADTDLITYNWRDAQPHPYPDFSINRKCRNINDLIAFRDERRVDMSKYEAMKKPKNANSIPMELGYYSMFGFNGSKLYPDGDGAPPLPEPNWFGRPGRENHR